MLKKIIFVSTICCSITSFAEEQHHNISVSACRALPYGDIQVRGLSKIDNKERSITFAKASFDEKVIGNFLSLCMTSLASSSLLRIDYLQCTNLSCVVTNNTSLTLLK